MATRNKVADYIEYNCDGLELGYNSGQSDRDLAEKKKTLNKWLQRKRFHALGYSPVILVLLTTDDLISINIFVVDLRFKLDFNLKHTSRTRTLLTSPPANGWDLNAEL